MNADTPASEAATTSDDRPGSSPYKLGAGIGIVLVLASILLFVSFLALWANRQIFDSKQWTKTSTEVIEQPAVQNALANYLVDQLFNNVNVEQEIKQQLPEDWGVLASPATSALRSITLSGTKKVLELPVAQEAWEAANQVAHQTLITTLEGGNDRVSTANGTVTVDARLILQQAANKLGLSGNLVDKIPASAGTFVIYQSDDLSTAQSVYKTFKNLSWVFALLTVLLYVLAIALAKGRRRRAVLWMGTSFVVVGLIVLIAQSLARSSMVDSLAQTQSVVPAVTDVYNIATELLRQMAGSLLFTGVLVLLAGLLAGPYSWAISVRRFLAPYLRDYLPLAAGAAALLFLILLWIAPVNGFRTAVGLTINLALAIAGFIALVTITRREFPDAAPADFGAAGDWIKSQWSSATGFVRQKTENTDLPSFSRGEEKTREIAVQDPPTAGGVDELERLARLHKEGTLSDAEFEAAKQKLLGG